MRMTVKRTRGWTTGDGTKATEIERPPRDERRRHTLRQCIKCSLEIYFEKLDGHAPGDLYELVLAEVERPLLEVVLGYTRGNLSKAAQILGLNRGTLRTMLKKYGMD